MYVTYSDLFLYTSVIIGVVGTTIALLNSQKENTNKKK